MTRVAEQSIVTILAVHHIGTFIAVDLVVAVPTERTVVART
jgi:hypothetical protein